MDTMFLSKFFLIVALANCLHDFHVSSCGTNCTDTPVFTPPRLVVKHGDPLSASCSVCPNCTYPVFDLENVFGNKTKHGNTILWEVEKMTEWNARTLCYYTDTSGDQATTELQLTVYKPPDSVSFSFSHHTGPLSENRPYTLQCEVRDVAPIANLTVTFYRGQTALTQLRSSQTGEKPVNETFYHHITLTKDDNGVQFWCEAKLELGPEGPQPPPVVTSHRTTASVHYEPVIPVPGQTTITIREGGRLELSCLAEGNPQPSYSWMKGQPPSSLSSDSIFIIESMTVEHRGEYTCRVNNSMGWRTVTYTVNVKADILLYIIIGIVSALIVIFSIVVLICTWYKHGRKGKYNMRLEEVICWGKQQGHDAIPIQG